MPQILHIERPAPPALIELRADAGAAAVLAARLGTLLPGGDPGVASSDGRTLLHTGPDRWLLRARLDEEHSLAADLEEAVRGRHAMVTVVSDAYAIFELHGTGVSDVLAQGVALDLAACARASGFATRCALARTVVVLHLHDPAVAHCDLYVESPLAGYLATWLATARDIARGEAPRRQG